MCVRVSVFCQIDGFLGTEINGERKQQVETQKEIRQTKQKNDGINGHIIVTDAKRRCCD